MTTTRQKKCSFCETAEDDCRYLIAGSLVYICERCVTRAHNAIRAAEADGGDGKYIELFDAIADVLTDK